MNAIKTTVFILPVFFLSCMSVNLNYKAVEDGFCFQKDDRVLVLAFTGGNAENKSMENFIVRHFSDRGFVNFYSFKEADPFGKALEEGSPMLGNIIREKEIEYLLWIALKDAGSVSKYIPKEEKTTVTAYGNTLYADTQSYGGQTVNIPYMKFAVNVFRGEETLAFLEIATGSSWYGWLVKLSQIYQKTAEQIFDALSK